MLKFYNRRICSLFNKMCVLAVWFAETKTRKKMKKRFSIYAVVLFVLSVTFSCNNTREVRDLQSTVDSLSAQLDRCNRAQMLEEENKKLVADMYQAIFGDKNIAAADQYISENYIQHNPSVADGREALKTALTMWFKNAPKEKVDIQRIGADNDLVFLHTRSKMGNATVSIIDIFRIENGKVAEHWDVIQEVPAKAANDHPMF